MEHLKGGNFIFQLLLPHGLMSTTVKLQLQTQNSVEDRVYKGPIDCAKQVVRAHGVLGLWSGFTGSLAFRTNFLWMFGSFEVLMRGFSRLDGTSYAASSSLYTSQGVSTESRLR